VFTRDSDVVAGGVYIALRGDHRNLFFSGEWGMTEDGYRVYNALPDEDERTRFPPTGCDVTVIPCDYYNGSWVPVDGSTTVGHSCDLALSVLRSFAPRLTPPVLFTGVVDHDGVVRPVLGVDVKSITAERSGNVIAGAVTDEFSSDGHEYSRRVRTVQQAVALAEESTRDMHARLVESELLGKQ